MTLSRRIWALAGFAALAPGCRKADSAPLRPSADQVRVRVLDWNIGRVYTHRWDSRADDDSLRQVVRVIDDVHPDFVALQELRDAGQVRALCDALGGRFVGGVPEHDVYDRHTTVLARADWQPHLRSIDTSTGRALAVARARVGGVSVSVASVHLDAFSARRRATQARDLAAWSDAEPAEVFLAGDFNFDADAAAEAQPETADLRTWRTLVRAHQDMGRFAGGTTILGTRIDYLLARSARIARGRVAVLPARRVKWMDHDPLLGEFLLDERGNFM